ncbi:hypothetical protein D3C75_1320250 [compost metagenome]
MSTLKALSSRCPNSHVSYCHQKIVFLQEVLRNTIWFSIVVRELTSYIPKKINFSVCILDLSKPTTSYRLKSIISYG